MVSGSVGAINGDVMKSAMTSSFHCSDEKQQQQRHSSNNDRRPGASTSSGRLTELRAQFGVELDTQRTVTAAVPSTSTPRSSSASHETTHDAGDLSLGHEDFDSFPRDCQPLSQDHGEYPDWQKNCESVVDAGDCHGSMSDLQGDAQYSKNNKNHNKTAVLDGQAHHQNTFGDPRHQQYLPDGHEMHNMLTEDQGVVPTTLNCAALNVKSRGTTTRHAARKLHRTDLGIDVGIGIGYGGGSMSDSEVTSLATTQQTSVITRNRLYHHHHHHHQLQQQGHTESKTNAQRIVRLRDVCPGPPRRIMQAICESPEIMNSNSTDIR